MIFAATATRIHEGTGPADQSTATTRHAQQFLLDEEGLRVYDYVARHYVPLPAALAGDEGRLRQVAALAQDIESAIPSGQVRWLLQELREGREPQGFLTQEERVEFAAARALLPRVAEWARLGGRLVEDDAAGVDRYALVGVAAR